MLQAPWATGLGTVGVVALIAALVFGTQILGVIAALLIVAGIGAALLIKRADADNPTPADPVTGGRRWWQKRWDE